MKINEIVRRTIADAALSGKRRWPNMADVAFEARCSVSSAFKAIAHLTDIGAVRKFGSGGISVVDPERVLMVLAATRDLSRDTVATTTRSGTESLIGHAHAYALGGTDAAVHHLGGVNVVADKGQRIVYVDLKTAIPPLPAGNEVRVMTMDAAAERSWTTGFTSLAQTYADLFAQPGWQASEFRRALWRKHFDVDDWSQRDQG